MISTDLTAYTSQIEKFSFDFTDLFQTPFDQTKVLSDIAFLQSLIIECNTLYDKREEHLNLISGYVGNLDTLWDKLQVWLDVCEQELESLTLSIGINKAPSDHNIERSQVIHYCNKEFWSMSSYNRMKEVGHSHTLHIGCDMLGDIWYYACINCYWLQLGTQRVLVGEQ